MLGRALSRLRHCLPVLGIWWLASLLVGLVAATPVLVALQRFFGSSLAETELRGGLELSHVVDLVSASPGTIPALIATVVAALLLWLLLSLALSAGTVGVLVEGRFSRSTFGESVGTWFGPLLRLELLGILLTIGLLLPALASSAILEAIGGEIPPEPLAWWGDRVIGGLALLGWLLTRLAVRFGRIHAISVGQRRARRALRAGLATLWRHWLVGLVLTLVVGAVGGFALWLEHRLSGAMPAATTAALLGLVVAQQALALVRVGARLVRTAAEVELATARRSAIAQHAGGRRADVVGGRPSDRMPLLEPPLEDPGAASATAASWSSRSGETEGGTTAAPRSQSGDTGDEEPRTEGKGTGVAEQNVAGPPHGDPVLHAAAAAHGAPAGLVAPFAEPWPAAPLSAHPTDSPGVETSTDEPSREASDFDRTREP